jgi:hypothetical protein
MWLEFRNKHINLSRVLHIGFYESIGSIELIFGGGDTLVLEDLSPQEYTQVSKEISRKLFFMGT